MWNGHHVMIVTPWKERILSFDDVERALFHMSLRPGVRRSEVLEYSVIDFVYSKRLRLRGLQRTCRSRNSDHPCDNCVFFRGRRKCLNPIYEYFLQPIGNVDPQSIDECLAHLLGHKPNCTRGRAPRRPPPRLGPGPALPRAAPCPGHAPPARALALHAGRGPGSYYCCCL